MRQPSLHLRPRCTSHSPLTLEPHQTPALNSARSRRPTRDRHRGSIPPPRTQALRVPLPRGETSAPGREPGQLPRRVIRRLPPVLHPRHRAHWPLRVAEKLRGKDAAEPHRPAAVKGRQAVMTRRAEKKREARARRVGKIRAPLPLAALAREARGDQPYRAEHPPHAASYRAAANCQHRASSQRQTKARAYSMREPRAPRIAAPRLPGSHESSGRTYGTSS